MTFCYRSRVKIPGHSLSPCFFASLFMCCIVVSVADCMSGASLSQSAMGIRDFRINGLIVTSFVRVKRRQSSNGGTAWLTCSNFVPPTHVSDLKEQEYFCLRRRNAPGYACSPPGRSGGAKTPRGRVWFQTNRRTCAGYHHIEATHCFDPSRGTINSH